MEKYYFKVIERNGEEICIEPCPFVFIKPIEGTMIGSGMCQGCRMNPEVDTNENWIKCPRLSKHISENEE